jgi:opacity protein-like surface antigen
MKKTLFASALALVFASTTAFAAPAVPPVPAHNAHSQNVTHKKVVHKNELHHKPVKKIVKKPVRKQVKKHYVKKQVKVNRGHPHIKGEHAKGQSR